MLLSLLLASALAAETRETFDGDGRVVTRQVIDGAAITAETAFTYDADGRLITQVTTTPGSTTREEHRFTYDKAGRETAHEVAKDGVLVTVIRTTWEDGQKARVESTTAGATTVSTWAYDDRGRVVSSQTTGGDGATTAAYQARYERPTTPIKLSLGGGVGYQTDVDLLSVNGAFSISRKPAVEAYGKDPLEVNAGVSYAFGRSKGETVNNQLNANFGLDLNLVAPRTTPFLFINVARNPVFNQNIDVLAAPVGVKFDLVPRKIMKLDFSLAPVLNYRSIAVPGSTTIVDGEELVTPDANQDFLKLRASARLRVGYEADLWGISDTLEYLPTLYDGAEDYNLSFGEQFSQDSILRNTFKLSLHFTEWMSFTNQLVFTRDLTLAAQADCSADPGNLLCDGVIVTNLSTLDFTWTVKR